MLECVKMSHTQYQQNRDQLKQKSAANKKLLDARAKHLISPTFENIRPVLNSKHHSTSFNVNGALAAKG